MKARRLKRLRIKRVDLVERGANQEADVVLFKSEKPPMKPDMKPEMKPDMDEEMTRCEKCNAEMKKGTKVCSKCGTEMKKAATAAKEKRMPENVEFQKLQEDLAAANKRAEEETLKREAVEKSLKEQGDTIAQLKKQIDDAQDAAKLAEFKKTVDAFEHLPVKADVFAPILKKCAEALDKDGYTELFRILKVADNVSGGNFVEIGAPGANTESRSATDELNAKVAELVAKGSKEPDAINQVMAQNPKLATRARREAYARTENKE